VALVVDSISIPAHVSRGQSFSAVISIRNSGGTVANAVKPSPSPATLTATGAAAATTASNPAAVTLAAGASATFTYAYVENGIAAGTLKLTAGAVGTDAVTNAAVTGAAASSVAMAVDAPAAVAVTSLTAPAFVSRGQSFPVSMTVTNSGQATATAVVPQPNPL